MYQRGVKVQSPSLLQLNKYYLLKVPKGMNMTANSMGDYFMLVKLIEIKIDEIVVSETDDKFKSWRRGARLFKGPTESKELNPAAVPSVSPSFELPTWSVAKARNTLDEEASVPTYYTADCKFAVIKDPRDHDEGTFQGNLTFTVSIEGNQGDQKKIVKMGEGGNGGLPNWYNNGIKVNDVREEMNHIFFINKFGEVNEDATILCRQNFFRLAHNLRESEFRYELLKAVSTEDLPLEGLSRGGGGLRYQKRRMNKKRGMNKKRRMNKKSRVKNTKMTKKSRNTKRRTNRNTKRRTNRNTKLRQSRMRR